MKLILGLNIFFVVLGFVALNVTETKHQRKGVIHKINSYIKKFSENTHKSNHAPRHLHKILDTSCSNTPPPVIKNGVLVEIKTQKIKNGSYKYTSYMLAEYKCRDGTLRHVFCSKRKWMGKNPLCSKHTTSPKHIPEFPVYLGKCSQQQTDGCKHFCVLLNGEPMCSCPPGFRKMNQNCVDVNECEDPDIKATCKYGCNNYNGSYTCLEKEEIPLADDPRANSLEDEEEYEDGDEYDEEEYDDTDYEDENYDEDKTRENDNKSDARENERKDKHLVNRMDSEETNKINEANKYSEKGPEAPENTKNIDSSLDLSNKEDEIKKIGSEDAKNSKKYNPSEYDDSYDEYEENTKLDKDKALKKSDISKDKEMEKTRKEDKETKNIDEGTRNSKKFDPTTEYDDSYDEYEENDELDKGKSLKKSDTSIDKKMKVSNKEDEETINKIFVTYEDNKDKHDINKEENVIKSEEFPKEIFNKIETTTGVNKITKKNGIIYDDEYDDDYDYGEGSKNVTNVTSTVTQNITKNSENGKKIGINLKEYDNNLNVSGKVYDKEIETNELFDKTTGSSINENKDEKDWDEYDEEYDENYRNNNNEKTTEPVVISSTDPSTDNFNTNNNIKETYDKTVDLPPPSTTSTERRPEATFSNNDNTATIERKFDERFITITSDTSTEGTTIQTESKSTTENKPKETTDIIDGITTTTTTEDYDESTEEYEDGYDETTDSISTTLEISTTNRPINSVEHPLMSNRFDKGEENNEIPNNLPPLNKNLTINEAEYEDKYDENSHTDEVEQENDKRTVINELDKNKTILQEETTTKHTDEYDNNAKHFITSTRLDELEKVDIGSSTTSRASIDTNEIDRQGSTTDYDDEYDYGSEDDDSDKEESTVLEKEVKTCETGYKLDSKGECIDIDECIPENNPCSDNCENTAGSYICSCPAGFKLNSADPHTCQDIDECEHSTCSHICNNSPGSFRCDCPEGLTLQNFTTCVNLTCSQGQTRVNGVLQCTCAPGFVLATDNRTCEDIDECLLIQDCAHNCRNVIGSYECSCREGYRLEREKFCVDIDECSGVSHGCDQICENTPGSYTCKCEEGYEIQNGTHTCVDIDECNKARDLDECNHICINYKGGYECSCYPGYTLGSDDATCEDIDECRIDNGNCTHICENLQGSYTCKCEENYSLENDKVTCRLLDPCLEENGGCSHECISIGGLAMCRCPKGYILEDKDCFLHDPCVTDNGGCSHICVNANNAVRCECPTSHELVNTTTCSRINLCTVNNGNCSHFCEFVEDRVNCMCPELYTLHNSTYCVESNPCLENNGGCSHICSFENHAQTCSCPTTHELLNETHCFERNPCLENNGGCSDKCIYSNNTLTCSCPENYYLEGKTCYRIDPCLENNGGCSHICSTDQENNVKCLCPDKFYLKEPKICEPQDPCLVNNGNCSHMCNSKNISNLCACPNGYRLKNENQCEQFNPCSVNNGGCSDICENHFGDVKCSCPVNYELDGSNNCVIVDPCHEGNGGCSHFCEYLDEVICSCPDHYNLVNGTTCVKVNPCLVNNGGCSHECSLDNKSNVICQCPKGHELTEKTCVPINPCNHKNGGCSHVCSSIEGIVICKCPPGFELIQKACFKMNPCETNNGGCSHLCRNHKGEAKCSCPPGYKLFGKICMDEDPCTKNNGGCSHICQSKEGKRQCFCPPGYILRPNQRICKEINECRLNRGGCSHGCKNLPGSYQCTCPIGLQLDDGQNRTCLDVDECLKDNGGCEMICRNFKGGFKCDCPEGYALQRDKKSCRMAKVALCRTPTAPKHGVIRCWDESSELGSFVPAGTKCNVWCNEGYKLVGESQRICSDSGYWGNKEPQCIVATCPKLPSIQNGWYLPGVCNSGRTYIGESCSVYCRKGFVLQNDIEKFVCDDNMNWMPMVKPERLYTACLRVPAEVNINCPQKGQIDFILPKGKRHMFVTIPRPEANVDWSFVTSQPSWGTRLETTLPAGRTEVRFMAASPVDFNSTSSCRLVINILDKEAPYMVGCPENIERKLTFGEATQIVHWKEPSFYDNVGVATVYKTREPGSEFGAGLHHITYVASDEAGNRAFCHFSIDVRDNLDTNELSNSVEQFSSATYTSHRTAGKYRAVLICPSGVQFMTDNPDKYNNMITNEAGCYWRHVKVTKPIQPQTFRVPKVYSESRLPANVRSNRRVFFKWN